MKKKLTSLILAAFTFGFLAMDGQAHKGTRWHNTRYHSQVQRKRVKALPAAVVVTIDKSQQRMFVSVNGSGYATWAVSTGKAGFNTPVGSYRPQRMARTYYSKKYDNAPMPNSVFFRGGFAIHGTGHIKNLGRPASHGCVRLAPGNAANLFNLVQRYGMRRVKINITG